MKTAIVTGATGNLGQAIVKKFLAEGFRVFGTVMPNDPAAIQTDNAHFEAVVVDLMSEEGASEFIQKITGRTGAIEVGVLTVGGFAMGSIEETGMADIRKQLALNFETTYHLARPLFLQMMKQNYGRIFLTAARPGIEIRKSKGMTAYGLSKSLVVRLSELMNEEARGHNVVTSVIAPSTIDTPQNRKSMPDADFSKWVKPEYIADTVHFYCTTEASALREPVLKFYNNA